MIYSRNVVNQKLPMKDVKIYSTPTCHFCHMTKDFLTDHNIPYTDYNVAADSEKRQEMLEKSSQMGVPVIIITDQTGQENIVVGFNEEKLRALLDI